MSDERRVVLLEAPDADAPTAGRLGAAGFDVVRTADVDDAVAALAEDGADVVVSTYALDDEGAAALRAVREHDPEVPLVLFSTDDAAAVAADPVEAVDHVRRDREGSHERLVARVGEAVGRRQTGPDLRRQVRRSEVIRDINHALVRADTRREIEQSVAERLAESGEYLLAWIAEVDDDGGVSLRAMGVEGAAIEGGGAIDISDDTAYTEPVLEAARRRAPVVVADPAVGAWEAALSRQPESVAAIPFVYEDRVYGVLVLYADRADAFDGEERRVLAEVGENVAYAMNAVAVRRKFQLRERALRRQNERLEEFAEVVSHDLRNPLTVARGSVDLLEDEGAHVERIEDSLQRMEAIIDDVLALARQGRTVGETEPVELAVAAQAAWGNVETGHATLETEQGDRRVEADRSRLVQLLENLFRNAVEHAAPGVVRVGATDDGFYVEDDGPGLPEEGRDELFESGFTTAEEGTGFGLAIVRSIAEAHGWEVAATDGTDGGARFEFAGVAEPGEDETATPFGEAAEGADPEPVEEDDAGAGAGSEGQAGEN